MSSYMSLGVAWCAFFRRRPVRVGPFKFVPPTFIPFSTIPPLRHAYRAPSHFLSRMQRAGTPAVICNMIGCDEGLQLQDLNNTRGMLHDESEIFYCCTHGHFTREGYRALLCEADWHPGRTGLGFGDLTVAVFDTCELVNGLEKVKYWSSARLGPKLRLLLGFDGPAIMDQGSSLRGKAFADLLLPPSSLPFAEAWLRAVQQTTVSPFSKAIAIALGDTEEDAEAVLATASLANLPGPRSGSKTFTAYRT